MKIATSLAATLLTAGSLAPAGAVAATTGTDIHRTVDVQVPLGYDAQTGEYDAKQGGRAEVDLSIDTSDQTVAHFQQESTDGTWADLDTYDVAPGQGGKSFTVPTGVPGTVTLRVVVDASTNFTVWTSRDFVFDISAAPENASRITLTAPRLRTATAGRTLRVTGRVSGGSRRTVRLELHTRNGWMRMSTSAVTDTSGRYVIKVPTDWYYTGTLRATVLADRAYPAAHSGTTFPMTVTPGYRPGGHARRWATFAGGARWNPCQAVTYKVNTTGAPRNALGQVKQAIAQVHAATGLRFVYSGSTKAVPYRTDHNGPSTSSADLTIGFGDARQARILRGYVVGYGGYQGGWSGSTPVIARAGVLLDRDAGLKSGFGDGPTWGTLMLHEIGHAVGLDHTTEPREVMYPAVTSQSRGHYQAGDLTGLRKVGAMGGCAGGSTTGADRLGAPRRHVSR